MRNNNINNSTKINIFNNILFFMVLSICNYAMGQSCPAPTWMWKGTEGTLGSGNPVYFSSLEALADETAEWQTNPFQTVTVLGVTQTNDGPPSTGVAYFGYSSAATGDRNSNGDLWNHIPGPVGLYALYEGAYNYPICPEGSSYSNDKFGVCVSNVTGKCGCAPGETFNPAANACMIPIPDPAPEPNADDNNGPGCPDSENEPTQPMCGNPINPGSGNKMQIEIDYATSDGGLAMIRTYNSDANIGNKRTGASAANWSATYDRRLVVSGTGRPNIACYLWPDDQSKFCKTEAGTTPGTTALTAVRNDGKRRYFTQLADGSFTFDPYVNDRMVQNPYDSTLGANYSYVVNGGDQEETYDMNGRLISQKIRNGRNQKITNFGSDNDSNIARYPSNAPICARSQAAPILYGDRILCVTDNWGRQLNFEYENVPGTGRDTSVELRITKMYDPDNKEYDYIYDGPSGGCDTLGGTGSACHANNLTQVTYPDGKSRIYHYNESSNINNGGTCPGAVPVGHGFGHLLNKLTGITDENGARFATWSYDCDGRATSSQHSVGAEKVTLSYSGTDAAGISTTTVSNYGGTPEAPVVTVRNYRYQLTNGKPLNTAIDQPCIGCSNVAARTYDANGNTASYTDWNGNKTTFVFDLTRNLQTSRTEAAGTANARTFTTAWHATLRLPTQIAGPKLITNFAYDGAGNLLTKTEQATTDANGATAFSATTVGQPRTRAYAYNGFGQVLSITGPRKDVADVTQMEYDTNGNLVKITNALKQVTILSDYDASRHVGKIVDPNGVTTTITYTPRGWLKSRTTSVGGLVQTTAYEYDGVGQMTKVTQPDGSSIVYAYDDAHRLTSITDGKGNKISYTLDIMSNRMTEAVSDPTGVLRRQVARVYDVLNRLKQQTGGVQ